MSIGPIILLESHGESRKIYEEALRRAGFAVVAVSTCDDAFTASTHGGPSLIVASFDANTRGQCLALCERLKTDGRTRIVPVILASTTIDDADLRSATDANVLALALPASDGAKLVAAVRGVLTAAEGRTFASALERPIMRSA